MIDGTLQGTFLKRMQKEENIWQLLNGGLSTLAVLTHFSHFSRKPKRMQMTDSDIII